MAKWRRGREHGTAPAPRHVLEKHALDIHDNIVQGLAEAQLALDVGRLEQARDAVERTLVAARRIVTDLMGDPQPGELRRETAADQPLPDS